MENYTKLDILLEGLPNPSAEKALVSELKNIDDSHSLNWAFNKMKEVKDRERITLVKILSKSLKQKNSLISLLQHGIEMELVSEIKGWVRYLLPKLGTRKILHILKGYRDEKEKHDIVFYHLKAHLKIGDSKDMQLIESYEKNQ